MRCNLAANFSPRVRNKNFMLFFFFVERTPDGGRWRFASNSQGVGDKWCIAPEGEGMLYVHFCVQWVICACMRVRAGWSQKESIFALLPVFFSYALLYKSAILQRRRSESAFLHTDCWVQMPVCAVAGQEGSRVVGTWTLLGTCLARSLLRYTYLVWKHMPLLRLLCYYARPDALVASSSGLFFDWVFRTQSHFRPKKRVKFVFRHLSLASVGNFATFWLFDWWDKWDRVFGSWHVMLSKVTCWRGDQLLPIESWRNVSWV